MLVTKNISTLTNNEIDKVNTNILDILASVESTMILIIDENFKQNFLNQMRHNIVDRIHKLKDDTIWNKSELDTMYYICNDLLENNVLNNEEDYSDYKNIVFVDLCAQNTDFKQCLTQIRNSGEVVIEAEDNGANKYLTFLIKNQSSLVLFYCFSNDIFNLLLNASKSKCLLINSNSPSNAAIAFILL